MSKGEANALVASLLTSAMCFDATTKERFAFLHVHNRSLENHAPLRTRQTDRPARNLDGLIG